MNVIYRTMGRRKLRQLLHHLLWPSPVRDYGFEPLLGI